MVQSTLTTIMKRVVMISNWYAAKSISYVVLNLILVLIMVLKYLWRVILITLQTIFVSICVIHYGLIPDIRWCIGKKR